MVEHEDHLKQERSRSTADALPANMAPGVNFKLAKLIAWIGASVGGLSIILLVVGFLALSAHDAMLGIPDVVESKPDYIVIGGLFFGRSIIFAVASLFFPKIASWLVLILLLASWVIISSRRDDKRVQMVLCAALVGGEFYALFCLIKPLQISNLLLTLSARPDPINSQIVQALLDNDMKWLEAQYGFIALLICSLLCFFYHVDRGVGSRRGSQQGYSDKLWHWLRIPLFIVLSICIFLLPRAYGVFTISNEYPEMKGIVRLSNPKEGIQSPLFLLREDEKSLVLYEPASQSILTMKRDAIEEYKITASQPIFSTK